LRKEARIAADGTLGDATRPRRATCPFNEIPLLQAWLDHQLWQQRDREIERARTLI
jgi:hypothetical protein